MSGIKHISMVILAGVFSSAGLLRAQEPELNIQAPATAPILETETPALIVTNEVKATPVPVQSANVQAATNAPPQKTEPALTHAPANAPIPTVHVAVVPTNAPVAVPGKESLVPESQEFFVDTWQNPSFQVGTRVLQVELKDKTRGEPYNGSFVGSITEITEEQDNAPDKLYAQVKIPNTFCWIGISYDHVRAQTMDDSDGDGLADKGGGDGSVDIEGFIPYLQAAWDNTTRFTPFIQLGYALYQCNFDESAAWSRGGRYVMDLDSTSGLELAGGLGIRIYRNLSADIFVRQMKVDDITGEYRLDGHKRSDIIYTMSYTAYGAGLNCRF